ncbi:DUF2249 domain-containing protein [Nakamurella panacisegetis]|uniref:DUF2249 domain-containing protein n=1 Tax=Nakamurella panacisegetis TaxID=1090615 RepID=UPI0038B26DE1
MFEEFAALPVAESFVLINGHDPRHLRQEFDRDHPESYGWEYLESGPVWRIRITKLSSTDLPRKLCDVRAVVTNATAADAGGAVWRLEVGERQLDANVVHLPPGDQIAQHIGPDLDVLIVIVEGDGELLTETGTVPLVVDALVWLPRRSQRSITAGALGLSYFSVHQRRPALSIGSAPSRQRTPG